MKKFNLLKYSFLVCFVLFCFGIKAQNNFKTKGIIIVDTLEFNGYCHIVGKNKDKFILSYDSTYHNNVEDFLKSGGSIHLNNLYFNLMLNLRHTKNINHNFKNDSLILSNKISKYTYRYKSKIVIGVISTNGFNNGITDYLKINLNPSELIWISTKVEN